MYVALPRCHVVPLRPHWHIECSVIILQSTLCQPRGCCGVPRASGVAEQAADLGWQHMGQKLVSEFHNGFCPHLLWSTDKPYHKGNSLGALGASACNAFQPSRFGLHTPLAKAQCTMQGGDGPCVTIIPRHTLFASLFLIKYKLCLLHTIEIGLFLH